MDLQTAWRRRALGAAGAGVIAPAAIIGAALAVGVGGGGLGGLGSLGQTLTGPQLPDVDTAAAVAQRHRPPREPGELLARAIPAPRQGKVARGRNLTTRHTGGAAPQVRKRATVKAPSPKAVPQGTAAPPASSPSPAPTPAPTPPPSHVHQLGDQVKGVTNQVPVVNGPAAEVVDLIVQTADSLPIHPK